MASSSGRGVFDGSVRVERAAQKTDAAQLSRNLLLVPRATVNVRAGMAGVLGVKPTLYFFQHLPVPTDVPAVICGTGHPFCFAFQRLGRHLHTEQLGSDVSRTLVHTCR